MQVKILQKRHVLQHPHGQSPDHVVSEVEVSYGGESEIIQKCQRGERAGMELVQHVSL